MSHISTADANAWLEPTKLTLDSLDESLEAQVSTDILSRLSSTFDTTYWVDETTTPQLIRTIIAMYYVAWVYDKTYSDNEENNSYAVLLRQYADLNIQGLLSGSLELAGDSNNQNLNVGEPAFFPNDVSSSNCSTPSNPSDGGPSFLMGSVF